MIRDLIDYANKQEGLPGYTLAICFRHKGDDDCIEGPLLAHGDDWLIIDYSGGGTGRDSIPIYIPENAIETIQINW